MLFDTYFFLGPALSIVGFCLFLVTLAYFVRYGSRRTLPLFLTGSILAAVGLLGYFIADHYTGVGINDAALFQVRHGINGLTTEMAAPIVITLGGVLAIIITAGCMGARKGKSHEARARTLPCLLIACLLLSPGYTQTADLLYSGWANSRLIQNALEGAQPASVATENFKNEQVSLVHIYAEGLERRFLDEYRFPGLTPHLNTIKKEALEIRGIEQVTMTGWTAAGLIASQCGFPGFTGSQLLIDPKQQTCVPTLLAPYGYQLSYMNGSSLEFSGKGDFWHALGYPVVRGDREVAKRAGETNAPMSAWGIYDDTLLSAAWNEYTELSNQNTPFVLTLLTVDTHAPHGMETPSCKSIPKTSLSKEHPMLGSVQCSDWLLGSFIEKLLEHARSHDKKLVVVLQSDHLQTPRAGVFPQLIKQYPQDKYARDNLFLAWGHGVQKGTLERQATSFDVAPTILNLLQWRSEALNLGRNLMGNEKTLMERHGRAWVEARMQVAMTTPNLHGAHDVENMRQNQAEIWDNPDTNKTYLLRPAGDPFLKETRQAPPQPSTTETN